MHLLLRHAREGDKEIKHWILLCLPGEEEMNSSGVSIKLIEMLEWGKLSPRPCQQIQKTPRYVSFTDFTAVIASLILPFPPAFGLQT